MNDKKTNLLWPREVGPKMLFLMKPLWISSDKTIHSCRVPFGIVDGKLNMLMRTFLTQAWSENMNMKYVYPIGEELVLSDFTKASLLLHGFNKINELKEYLTPELFSYNDATEYVDEDDFYRYK